jgi:hypothetical protein
MHATQMKDRCPDSSRAGTGELAGFKFIINSRGKATIIPKAVGSVHGVLWSISDKDRVSLDNAEGVSYGTYSPVAVTIVDSASASVIAVTYIAADHTPGRPKAAYLNLVLDGGRSAGLPETYLAELQARALNP